VLGVVQDLVTVAQSLLLHLLLPLAHSLEEGSFAPQKTGTTDQT
jgi:hypothetical protein